MDIALSLMNLRRGNSQTRRGVMLPLVAILLPVVLVLMGFAVDLAYMQNTRMELRAATDVAARAAATKLSQTDSEAEAIARAKEIAGMNKVAGRPLELEDSDITIGRSEPNSSGRWMFTANAFPPNAVHIEGNRTRDSAGGSVPLFFGSLIGRQDFEPILSATASFLNVDICLVLDRSTSMKLGIDENAQGISEADPRLCSPPGSASRWAALNSAVGVFVQTLNDSYADEHVALVTYAGDSASGASFSCGSLPTPSTLDSPLDGDLSLVDQQMARLNTTVWNGYTYIESGMRTGLDELTNPSRSRSYANKVMIVLTDGNENVGSARLAAQSCAGAGVIVNTITFSDYANQETMRDVASIGGGRHYHATTSEALESVFRELAAEISRMTE